MYPFMSFFFCFFNECSYVIYALHFVCDYPPAPSLFCFPLCFLCCNLLFSLSTLSKKVSLFSHSLHFKRLSTNIEHRIIWKSWLITLPPFSTYNLSSFMIYLLLFIIIIPQLLLLISPLNVLKTYL
jgi:hypothetical protein